MYYDALLKSKILMIFNSLRLKTVLKLGISPFRYFVSIRRMETKKRFCII